MAANPLGYCLICSGDLCMRPDRIACIICGQPVLDHPATPGRRPAAPPILPVVGAEAEGRELAQAASPTMQARPGKQRHKVAAGE